MTTSSSDTSRCTRISPSAVLDDRLDGKDLEWARDHLRRCEACRERVEDFREMLLRVGRLPKATVGAPAMDQAFAASIPERLRDEVGPRSYQISAPDNSRLIAPLPELPAPMQPELAAAPDLMTELEREIFRDEPAQFHPTPLEPLPEPIDEPISATPVGEDEVEPLAADSPSPISNDGEAQLIAPLAPVEPWESPVIAEESTVEPPAVAQEPPSNWREVAIDSHRESEPPALDTQPVISTTPEPEHRNVIYEEEPAVLFDTPDEGEPAPPKKPDTAMRLMVGLGAAACVLLAALLYEGSYLLKGIRIGGVATASATVSTRASSSHKPPPAASVAPLPSKPPATVLYTLGNGVSGGTVFRIRPGTAVAGYTRLVFDIRGSGLPSMIVTRPDDAHIQVIFKETTVTGAPVAGIKSYHVSAVEPGVQSGPDGAFLIDLARPVRVTAFTLAASGSYAWRLVVDLHTS